MIKTLKSELKLRPTYDEMTGMIEAQGDPNRPSIENVIDRKATLFRNNQVGSQLDNIDFLGLKKQEEDRAKEDVRRAQLRQRGITAGISTGLVSSGFTTPAEVYEMDTDEEGEGYVIGGQRFNIRTELEEGLRRREQASQTTAERARSDLDEVHSQSLPAGVPVHSIATDEEDDMPALETPTEIAEEGEEEETEDDEETQVPPVSRKHKETIDYNDNIARWKHRDVSADDILFQLYLRGITLEKEQEEDISKLRNKGKGRTMTKKDYLLNFIEKLMETGQWTNEVNDQLLKNRMEEWRQMKKGKGKSSASSSSALDTAKDIAIGGVKAGVETLAKAGATALAKSFLPV